MSRNFEQEYRDMMKSGTPDLWDRIEAGVNASERSNNVIMFSPDLRSADKKSSESSKKGAAGFFAKNRYQVMAVAGAAACLALFAGVSSSGQITTDQDTDTDQSVVVAEVEIAEPAVDQVIDETEDALETVDVPEASLTEEAQDSVEVSPVVVDDVIASEEATEPEKKPGTSKTAAVKEVDQVVAEAPLTPEQQYQLALAELQLREQQAAAFAQGGSGFSPVGAEAIMESQGGHGGGMVLDPGSQAASDTVGDDTGEEGKSDSSSSEATDGSVDGSGAEE